MTLAVKYQWQAIAAILLVVFFGCHLNKPVRPLIIKGETQGTYFIVTYYDSLNRNFTTQIDSMLEAVDKSVSVYRDNSLISRLNRNEDVQVDDIFAENFFVSTQISEASGGAFDCTIGRLIEAWGWGFSKRDSVTPELIDSLRGLSGYRRIRIEDGKLVKDNPAITVNFNAIAQGYTSDLIARFLIASGVKSFLVDVGGELVGYGTKPGGELWTIGVEMPAEGTELTGDLMDRPVKAVLTITGKGIATSGNYRKFYVEDGIKYSHTIDPATGYPVQHSLLSATVVAENATIADAWATAFMVMGLEKAIKVLEINPALQAYFIYADDKGKERTWISGGLRKSIRELTEE